MARTHEKVGYPPEGKVGRASPSSAATGVEGAIRMLEGRWKLLILYQLKDKTRLRFSELERSIPEVSQKMLIQQLRSMERDGLVERTVHPQVPPKVEYHLSKWGRALCPALDQLLKWAALRRQLSR